MNATRIAGPAVLCLLVGSVTAAAGPAETARRAAAAAEAKKPEEAFDLLRTALTEQWAEMPFALRSTELVTEKPVGYGMYAPRANNRYHAGEAILLYTEPVGYKVTRDGAVLRSTLSADLRVLDAKGKELATQKDFGKWSLASRRFATEFFVFFTVNLTGAPPGEYTVEIPIHDQGSGKTATLQQAIVVE